MAFAKCVKNIRYPSAPRHMVSWIKEILSGSKEHRVIDRFTPQEIQVKYSFADALLICGFLGKIYLQAAHSPPMGRCNRFSRYSVRCRGPPVSKFCSKNFDTHRRNRYDVLEQRKRGI